MASNRHGAGRHDIALGYGSKWHLLRYLGYHRAALNSAVEAATLTSAVRWLDFPFDPNHPLLDSEWKGIDFLSDDDAAKREWTGFWPQTGNVPNWDAVGWAERDEQTELLLVEAKAHVGELRNKCGARERGGRPQIRRALDEARLAFGSCVPAENWLAPYYQYCNRLAVLYFLQQHEVPARLVFVYFTGDNHPKGTWNCPTTAEEWTAPLEALTAHVGLTGRSELEQRVHKVIVPVCPQLGPR